MWINAICARSHAEGGISVYVLCFFSLCLFTGVVCSEGVGVSCFFNPLFFFLTFPGRTGREVGGRRSSLGGKEGERKC